MSDSSDYFTTTPTMSYTGLQNLALIGRVTTLVVNKCTNFVDSVSTFISLFIITMCYRITISYIERFYTGVHISMYSTFIILTVGLYIEDTR